MSIKKWRLKSSRPIIESPWMSVSDNTYDLGDGNSRSGYFHVHRPPYVVCLAASVENRILVIRQYRRGVDEVLWELPAGNIVEGETPEAAAIREIREETGYVASDARLLGVLDPQPAFSSMKAHIVRLKLGSKIGRSGGDEDERIEETLMTESEIDHHIKTGVIKDMAFVSSWSLYRLDQSA